MSGNQQKLFFIDFRFFMDNLKWKVDMMIIKEKYAVGYLKHFGILPKSMGYQFGM